MVDHVSLPSYLESFELFQQHIRGQLDGLSTTDKGKRFAQFVKQLVPQSDGGANFDAPELNSKITNDGGVDLIGRSKISDKTLYIQSKLWVDRADMIDSVISKFKAFKSKDANQLNLFSADAENNHFMLVTLSPLKGILEQYKKKQYSSKDFYDECIAENRVYFVDGHEILTLVKNAYSKLNQVPTDLTINFEVPYISKDNVYIGILSNFELKELHKSSETLYF